MGDNRKKGRGGGVFGVDSLMVVGKRIEPQPPPELEIRGESILKPAPAVNNPTHSAIPHHENDMPPEMVRACQRISKSHKGVIFAFRDNASLPVYEQNCVGKPHMIIVEEEGKKVPKQILGKTSNQGFVEGLLAVEDERHHLPLEHKDHLPFLGKVEDGIVRTFNSDKTKPDMPIDPKTGQIQLPIVQHKQSLLRIMEGLQSKRFKIEGDPSKDGILKVRDMKNQKKDSPPVYFFIDLKDPNCEKKGEKIKHEDIRITPDPEQTFKQPKFWKKEFGDWNEKLNSLYPASYEFTNSAGKQVIEPLMVYALPPTKDSKPVPITGDQDLVWITVPTGLQLPASYSKEFDTEKDDDSVKNLLREIVEVSKFFNKENPIIETTKDIPDDVAGFGKITPFEAYMAILLNKELGISLPHARKLVQHGAENHFGQSKLQNINHVGWLPDENKGLSCQTQSMEELIKLVTQTPGYGDKNFIELHDNWKNQKVWQPLVAQQNSLQEARQLELKSGPTMG